MSSESNVEHINDLLQLLTSMESGRSDDSRESRTSFFDALHRFTRNVEPFDWMDWNKGIQGLNNAMPDRQRSDEIYCEKTKSTDFSEFDRSECMQILTMIPRIDRFNDGFFDQQITNGVFKKVLNRLATL